MIVNIKGVGRVEFPDGMSVADIKAFLSKRFTDSVTKEREKKEADNDNIKSIVKLIMETGNREINVAAPEVKVDVEPVITVTPEIDMKPVADAIKSMQPVDPKVELIMPENNKQIKIDVERDNRGFIKSLICTEV